MTHPLSVQLWTVRDPLSADREDTLRRLAEIGYTHVEPFNPTADPEGFRKTADDLGISVSGAHAQGIADVPDPAPVFEAVATLGTDLAIVPAGLPENQWTSAATLDGAAAAWATHDGLNHVADRLNELAAQAAAFGLRLGYHNHWWEFEAMVDGRPALEVLAELVAPQVVFEVDTYWAAVGGADPAAVLARLGDRVEAIHVKDGPIARDEPHVAVGQGAMPVPAILAAAPSSAWRVVELDSCATDIFDAVADSFVYLSGMEGA